MGKQLQIDGEEQDVEEDTTVAELKDETNASENDIAVYTDDEGEMVALSDDDTVAEIPEGATLTNQPQKGRIFG
jgi:sulfur carrier protein ThiS